jgi:hypothetical protein
MRHGLYPARLLPAALGLLLAAPAFGWTPHTQTAIAREAARLAPPDLARQLEKHQRTFEAGVLAPLQQGSGEALDQAAATAVQNAVAAIKAHQPFEEIVQRLGTVAFYMAAANDPLAAGSDPEEGRYSADYLRYAESAEPRFPLIFYGISPALDKKKDLRPVLTEALRRGRDLYPLVAREYRKIDYASGIGRFDDRSTAFGVASVAFSHAVTDVTLALRYIWITAGGADDRTAVVNSGTRLLVLPRAEHGR